ncbi:MAG: hypothetical protein Q9166_006769 [cf. Caloplaca sp. 2 TL-2023]
METAIRWSPSSDIQEQRFLLVDVTGHSFTHCRVKSFDGKTLKYEAINANRQVPTFRAFDWSPQNESILAVGESSGCATVLSLDDSQVSPFCLRVKQPRPCNAVVFSKTGLLATGLEKVRNDFSLNIWDVSQRLSVGSSLATTSPGRSMLEPIRKFASSEAITSIRFFLGQPDTFVAGVKGACIRLYDLRENVGNAALQFQTACVHNLSIDPLDENYIASGITQKDTTIQIWDRRFGLSISVASLGAGISQSAPVGPVIEYQNAFESLTTTIQTNLWSLRHCKGQSGYLGALSSNGDFKVFEAKQAYTCQPHETHDQLLSAQSSLVQTEARLCAKRTHHVETLSHNVNAGRQENTRIVSFDFTNLAGPKGMPSAITLRGTGSVEIYELKGPPPTVALSSLGQLVGSGASVEPDVKDSKKSDSFAQLGLFYLNPSMGEHATKPAKSLDVMDNSQQANEGNLTKVKESEKEKGQLSSREKHEKWFENQTIHQIPNIEAALATFTVDRGRCMQGYLFDCEKNADIVADDPWLKEMWEWLGRAKRIATDETFVVRGIDLSYLGVYNIWNVDLGSERAARISGSSENTEILYAVEAICRSLDLPELTSIESSLPAHRRLSLYICGFGLPDEEFNVTIEDLINQGQNTKAAFLALTHDRSKQALSALKSGAASANRELSLALAGFVKGTIVETWKETIQDIVAPLTDPYARGILALVRTGSWHDVLSETSLPLKFRIGVALMYLTDDDLTDYIASTTHESTNYGDIEGLVLTGLSEKAVPLLQKYILRYHDLQTAILVISHTSPRYFSSGLVDIWRSEYRAKLNTYRLFIPRVRFDTQATKLSVSNQTGKPSIAPVPRQVSIKCNHCEQALDRDPTHASTSAPMPPSFTPGDKNSNIFKDDAKIGTACPKCGKHLPRCVICMHWLGMPDPHTKGGAHANAAAVEKLKEMGDVKGEGEAKGKRGKGRYLMKDMVCVCQGCWHMSHVGHAEEWFEINKTCPVPGCECRCGERNGGYDGVK